MRSGTPAIGQTIEDSSQRSLVPEYASLAEHRRRRACRRRAVKHREHDDKNGWKPLRVTASTPEDDCGNDAQKRRCDAEHYVEWDAVGEIGCLRICRIRDSADALAGRQLLQLIDPDLRLTT